MKPFSFFKSYLGCRKLKKSGLFDAHFYLLNNDDVRLADVEPLRHYFVNGWREGRNPSASFDTGFYLGSNADVAASGMNPLLHYLLYGAAEGRAGKFAPISKEKKIIASSATVDIVIPVYNALDDVQRCLPSVEACRDGFQCNVIVVNDGSEEDTTLWLRDYCAKHDAFKLIEFEKNIGYTKALNAGLKASSGNYVITLNSDTIVSPGWLMGLVRCMESDNTIGVVGPLSNAASWQNVPKLKDDPSTFSINRLPEGMQPADMARLVSSVSERTYPRLPFVNGFCFMISRKVFDSIGFMDEKNFPVGYGEENDFCVRVADAGFSLAIADDTYVYHAKSKSFGHDRRKELSAIGNETLRRKHGGAKFDNLVRQVSATGALDQIRQRIDNALEDWSSKLGSVDIFSLKILFVLPVGGGGGGVHSIVQEVAAMRRMGVSAAIAVRSEQYAGYLQLYQDISHASDFFVDYFSEAQLGSVVRDFNVVVGTIYSSLELIRRVVNGNRSICVAYYVQDYEPMFFKEGSPQWEQARRSYSLIPDTVLFAKTHWIAKTVQQAHGVHVHKVSPSIDHEVYRPLPRDMTLPIRVSAMIRPQTPYRGAERTMRVLSRLAALHSLTIDIFGCDDNDERFLALDRDFDYHNHGILRRPDVARLLAGSDLFIDLSDYQAFGRTALEAMACGSAAAVTCHGGTDEYAINNVNALLLDSLDEEACLERISSLLANPQRLRHMQREGLLTASRFSVQAAAVSELVCLSRVLSLRAQASTIPTRQRMTILPGLAGRDIPAGSAYVRLLMPYGVEGLIERLRLSVNVTQRLPDPGSCEILCIQRDMHRIDLEQFSSWLEGWRAAGGKILYDLDDDMFDQEGMALRTGRSVDDLRTLAERVALFIREADVVTVSTPALVENLRAMAKKVMLVENYLDAKLWRLGDERPADAWQRQEGDPVRIGYIGTPTHDHDLAIVREAIQRIEKEFGERVEVEVIGAFQNSEPMFGKRVALPRNSVYPNFVDWLVKRVHWDIGIIPLQDDVFNKSKSFLKFIEYSALNLSIICSNVSTYSSVARHGENALVVPNETQAWYEALRELILDKQKREKLATEAHRQLCERYTIQANESRYHAVLDQVLSKDV